VPDPSTHLTKWWERREDLRDQVDLEIRAFARAWADAGEDAVTAEWSKWGVWADQEGEQLPVEGLGCPNAQGAYRWSRGGDCGGGRLVDDQRGEIRRRRGWLVVWIGTDATLSTADAFTDQVARKALREHQITQFGMSVRNDGARTVTITRAGDRATDFAGRR
jgi:hypothetical protein